jgi:hypothetical protein
MNTLVYFVQCQVLVSFDAIGTGNDANACLTRGGLMHRIALVLTTFLLGAAAPLDRGCANSASGTVFGSNAKQTVAPSPNEPVEAKAFWKDQDDG